MVGIVGARVFAGEGMVMSSSSASARARNVSGPRAVGVRAVGRRRWRCGALQVLREVKGRGSGRRRRRRRRAGNGGRGARAVRARRIDGGEDVLDGGSGARRGAAAAAQVRVGRRVVGMWAERGRGRSRLGSHVSGDVSGCGAYGGSGRVGERAADGGVGGQSERVPRAGEWVGDGGAVGERCGHVQAESVELHDGGDAAGEVGRARRRLHRGAAGCARGRAANCKYFN